MAKARRGGQKRKTEAQAAATKAAAEAAAEANVPKGKKPKLTRQQQISELSLVAIASDDEAEDENVDKENSAPEG